MRNFFLRIKRLKEPTDILYFTSLLLSSQNDKGTLTYSLYPYNSEKIAVIFVYGVDFERQLNIWMVSGSDRSILVFIGIFVCLAAIILVMIRRKFELRYVMSSFIDIIVAFIAGGSLHMRYKWERWFFGILLIAAFFIISLFTGDLLDCVIAILNQNINRFEQLAVLSTPIYVHPAIKKNVAIIQEILKLVIVMNIEFQLTNVSY